MTRAAPTQFPELNEVLEELTSSVQAVLRESFVGLYLQGSLAVGDFDEHSDADFIVVTEGELSEDQGAALQGMHARIFDGGKEWAKHLEGSYVPKAVLRDLACARERLWYLDNGHRHMEQSAHCNTVVVRWIVRERGIPLAGPDPKTLIGPIPPETLSTEIGKTIKSWGREFLEKPDRYRNHFYQTFTVLNLARMLHDFHAGSISSKRTGAEWAKKNLDPKWSDLIDKAWDGRPDPASSVRTPADPRDFERTLEYVRYIMAEVEKGSGAA